ncbi:glycosyltransferase family 4 protein [Desulforhopalus singaporensis]|uniref:Glycosyltransferase involved in cell wall bisynthesis n=1 Tax=Desulforhopalus singaporensis TaxID=91360 RepID=A0A1H0M7X1_9BACT|nr:glycosyltransferase family 4 protein [Desulforhopalus singaporensis]SDO76326.1 Glycosyltransferase involved in cell wall bisynthesis [Desulforhopalus singaporensis]
MSTTSAPHTRGGPVLAYVLKGYPRISETFISNEILLLEQLGFAMHLFPMRQPRETFCHDSVKKIRARVDYLPTELTQQFCTLLRANIFLAAKKPAAFREALRHARAGLSVKTGNLATLKHLLQAGFLTNNHLLGDSRISQLHGHFAHSPTSVTLMASIFSGLPFSFTAHAKDIYTSEPGKLRRKMEKARFVITCTDHNRKYLESIAQGVSTPVYCVYHGIDLALFSNPEVPRVAVKPPYHILTVARMTEKKGLPTIYRALALLKAAGIRFRHTLIGDGDDREKILELIDSLKLDQDCRWLGTRTHQEVLEQFRQSDLFVLGCNIAKNGDRDGIPNVLVESLAMGVPAVSTSVSAIPELLVNNETGITVDPGDPTQLAAAMKNILTDAALRRRLISGGKRIVAESFDNRMWITRLAELFRRHNDAFGPHLSRQELQVNGHEIF